MRMYAFSVRDSAVGAFLPPLFARSKGEAIRMFQSACADGSHQFGKFKKDYALFSLGEFDDSSGMLIPVLAPVQVITALELDAPEGASMDN